TCSFWVFFRTGVPPRRYLPLRRLLSEIRHDVEDVVISRARRLQERSVVLPIEDLQSAVAVDGIESADVFSGHLRWNGPVERTVNRNDRDRGSCIEDRVYCLVTLRK